MVSWHQKLWKRGQTLSKSSQIWQSFGTERDKIEVLTQEVDQNLSIDQLSRVAENTVLEFFLVFRLEKLPKNVWYQQKNWKWPEKVFQIFNQLLGAPSRKKLEEIHNKYGQFDSF